MARILEEREEVIEDSEVEVTTDEQETQAEALSTEAEETTPEPEQEIPQKYQGKSTAEIIRMHQEAEKLLGKQSSEVGELRKVVDDYIQTQLSEQAPQEVKAEEEVDFFSDPDKAVDRAINNHPKIKEAEKISNQYRHTTAMAELQRRHPDMQDILQDPKFADWIKGSKIRTKLFAEADRQYDFEAADELFTNWKERQQVVSQTAATEKTERKKAVKAASTGNVRGSGEQSAKKVYRRSDIIKLMKEDPERYMSLSNEIMAAYADGRVRQ
jgi:hypothetical protein|tara:strand:- start:1643 stop:2452 length:810 start_codon:yes stop_codon:yes gene_type:complete